MREKLNLYKNRIKALRADNGSVEWHQAVAKIRAHNGDTVSALGHAISASLKQVSEAMNGMFGAISESLSELNASLESDNLYDATHYPW